MRSRSSRSSGASRGSPQCVIMLSNAARRWETCLHSPVSPRTRTLGPLRTANALVRPSVSPIHWLSAFISGDLLPPLGRLIAKASRQSQIVVVTHAAALLPELDAATGVRRIILEKQLAETLVQDNEGFGWT